MWENSAREWSESRCSYRTEGRELGPEGPRFADQETAPRLSGRAKERPRVRGEYFRRVRNEVVLVVFCTCAKNDKHGVVPESTVSPFKSVLQFVCSQEASSAAELRGSNVLRFFVYPPLPPVSRAVRTERRVASWDLKGTGSQTKKPLQDFRVGKKNVRESEANTFAVFVTNWCLSSVDKGRSGVSQLVLSLSRSMVDVTCMGVLIVTMCMAMYRPSFPKAVESSLS